ncbi:hypothetical protein CR513_20025, partial [Mucuna pruriens]
MTLGFICVLQDELHSSSTCNKVTHFGASSDSLCSKFSLIPKLRPDKDCFIILVLYLVMGPLVSCKFSLALLVGSLSSMLDLWAQAISELHTLRAFTCSEMVVRTDESLPHPTRARLLMIGTIDLSPSKLASAHPRLNSIHSMPDYSHNVLHPHGGAQFFNGISLDRGSTGYGMRGPRSSSDLLHDLDLEIEITLHRLRKARNIVVSNSSNFVSSYDNSSLVINTSDFVEYSSTNNFVKPK